jgi:hypothetical protein
MNCMPVQQRKKNYQLRCLRGEIDETESCKFCFYLRAMSLNASYKYLNEPLDVIRFSSLNSCHDGLRFEIFESNESSW